MKKCTCDLYGWESCEFCSAEIDLRKTENKFQETKNVNGNSFAIANRIDIQ